MSLSRAERTVRWAAAFSIVCLSLLVFASAHSAVATATVAPSDTSTSCAPEVATCSQQAFPCPVTCSATAGPVTNVGLNQAVYVDVTGVPQGDELEIAYCSLAGTSTQVVAQPQCASEIPGTGGTSTPTPLQYQYGTVTSNQTILAMPTEFDPNIPGATPIVSQTSNQLFGNPNVNPPVLPGTSGTFFCDNASNPCGIEIMDIPQAEIQNAGQDGFAPQVAYSAVGHTVIFPLTFNQGGSGCGSAPIMQVDASYSVEQFIPAAGEATCTGPGGVAAVPTELPSVDDSGCASGTGTHCPIYDVIDGSSPVTFTDDPEDPATIAELKAAGGKFAYIPIAASATEIAFSGAAGSNPPGGSSSIYPLSSYQLTPAMAAGVMTQLWTAATASSANTNDDLCGQLPGQANCTETQQSRGENLNVDVATNGKTDNLDVTRSTSLSSKKLHFDTYDFPPPDNFSSLGPNGGTIGASDLTYYGDTGFTLLNPWPFDPGNITTTEQQLGAMWPSTASGASYETTSWMCQAPNLQSTVPLPFGGSASVHDLFSGQQILADAELGPVAASPANKGLTPGVVDQHILYPANKCQALSSLPIDFAGNNSVVNSVYNPSSSPLTAAHVVLGAVPKYGGTGGFAFTAMDSSEADFFGLLPASLQNAAGGFVGPSAQSIDAALNDATTNADGTLSPNLNDTGDAGAYPLPMVTYALVSTSPQPGADQATQLKDLLTNLVTYSHDGGSTSQPMPSGYVPLPQSLYNQAITEIANITGTGGSTPGGSNGTSGSGGPATSAGAGGGATGRAGPFGGATGRGPSASGRGGGQGAATNGTPSSGSGASSPGNFAGHLITVTVGDSRFFVPALLLLALLCLIVGPVLYMSPTLRRPARATGNGGAEASADDAPGASGAGPPESG